MSDLLEHCAEHLTKAWDLPDISSGPISSSHPSTSSELAEIFGRSDDEDEEFEAFGGNQETQLANAGLLQQTSVASMEEILGDSKISLNSAQQSIKDDKTKSPEEPRRSARLQSISKSEVNQITENKSIKVEATKGEAGVNNDQRSKAERTESGSEGIYSEGSDDERKEVSDEENSSGEGDDPDKLWCICRKPHGDRFMICCDQCEEWYHGDCVGISVAQGKRMERYGEDYVCMQCKEKEQFAKEERRQLRAERLEKREANKSKEFGAMISMAGAPAHLGNSLFTPDNLPMGKTVLDIKKSSPAVDSHPKRATNNKVGVKCLHCTAPVDPPVVMCSNDCIRKHVRRGIEILTSRGVNVAESEGVAVVDKSAGRVIVGGAAPGRKELIDWLQSHRSYQMHLPANRRPSSTNKEPADNSSQTKVTKVANDSTQVRENAKKLLAQALWHRCETADDDIKSITTKEQVEKLANQIEEDLFSLHNEITLKYKNKYRSLLFNLRDSKNQGLFQKVVRGRLETKELVTLSSEQLASEELTQWRQQEIKKHLEKIKEREEEINRDSSGTKRKITYKGEIEIEATEKEQAISSERPQSAAIIVSPSSITSPGLPVNTTSHHASHTFDANCDICQGKLVTTSIAPVKLSVAKEKAPVDDDKLPRKHDVITSKPLYLSKWKGLISMPTFTKFVASARGLSGASDYMLELLPDILNVEGRIGFSQVWEYLAKLQISSSRDISVICFESVSEADDQANYIALLDYLVGRDRCGVVAIGDREIKDFYLVPLTAGSPIPQQLPSDCKKVLSIDDSREDVLLGVIVHNKVLGRSRHHHHHHRDHRDHHRHKRTHPPHHNSFEKRSKLEVGIGDVTPPESPKKPSATAAAIAAPIAPPAVTLSVTTTITPTVTSIPSMYGSGENEVTSTSITHFSAGIKDDTSPNNDAAYSPSDDIEKSLVAATAPPVTSEQFITPSLSPNTMSRLQSLIQTVKESIASLPSPSCTEGAAAKQENIPQSTVQSQTTTTDTSSAYVFHESLPVTTSVTMATNLIVTQQQTPSTRQNPSFYGNQEVYNPPPPMYGNKRSEPQFDNHHGYQGQREQWIPYRSNWSPQRR